MSYIFNLVLVVVLLFFLFLPITDRRTVMLKLGMMLAVVMLFAATLAAPHGAAPAILSAHAVLSTAN